jgi:hypothetical protein
LQCAIESVSLLSMKSAPTRSATFLALISVFGLMGPATAGVVPKRSGAERILLTAKSTPALVHGTWKEAKRGLAFVEASGGKGIFFPKSRGFRNGLLRMRVVTGRRMDLTLVFRATANAANPSAVSGYGIRLQSNRVSVVSIRGGKLHTLKRERVKIAGRKRVEVVVLLKGNRLLAQIHGGWSGKHRKTITASIGGSGNRVGLIAGKKHRKRNVIQSISMRSTCKGQLAGPMGPSSFVSVAVTDEGKTKAAAKGRVSFMERATKKKGRVAIFKTDTLGVEALLCAGVSLKSISQVTPFKYLDDAYRRYRKRGPISTKTGFRVDASYKNPKMVRDLMKAYAKRFPDLTELHVIGKTRQGRKIYALAIGTKVKTHRNKPTILLNGAHHGNEALSVEFIFDAIQMLLEKRDEPRIKRWLDNLIIWAIPMVNPDGSYAFLETTRRTGRKNGRDNDGNGKRDRLDGVDLNRNYPFRWHTLGEKGSHSRTTGYWYRGPKAASEPETQAMMALADSEVFAASLTYHVGTVKILAPYTIDKVTNPEPNEAWVVAEEIVKLLPPHPDKRDWVVQRNLYSVDGTDQDWHRFAHGTLALLIEGARTSPTDSKKRRNIVIKSRALYTGLLDRYLDGPAVHGFVTDKSGRPVKAEVHLAEVTLHHNESWKSRCRDGHYDWILSKPGKVTLVVKVPGMPVVRKAVNVTKGRIRMDVQLPYDVAPGVCSALPGTQPVPGAKGKPTPERKDVIESAPTTL